MWDTIVRIFPYAILYSIPLLATSLGGLYSERSGIVNIGLEGLMVVGSFSAAVVIFALQGTLGIGAVWIGLLAAMIVGAAFSLLHAFACINLNANQVISGIAINMIAAAITVFLAKNITGSGNIAIKFGLPKFDVPLLSEIPIIGKLFFTGTYATTWIVLLLLFLSYILIYKTPLGLRLRACGEHPQAADAAGINVYRIRYFGVAMSGALAGLGGGIILVTISTEFSGTGSMDGLGFLALAALIFGQWKPLGILGATFFFGFFSTLAKISGTEPALNSIPEVLLKAFPYIVTLIALVLFSKSSRAPKAAGEIFDKAKR